MTKVEFWFWMIRDAASGERVRSTGRLTESEAKRRDPDAMRVDGSCEVRTLPRHPDSYLPHSVVLGRSAQRQANTPLHRPVIQRA